MSLYLLLKSRKGNKYKKKVLHIKNVGVMIMRYKQSIKSKQISRSKTKDVLLFSRENGDTINTSYYWNASYPTVCTDIDLQTGESKDCPDGRYPNFDFRYEIIPGHIILRKGLFNKAAITPYVYYCSEDLDKVKRYLDLK